MRIRTLTNWAYGVTVVLTAASGAAFFQAAEASSRERAALEQHLAFDTLAEDLALESERQTDEARLFAMRAEPRHLQAYRQEVAKVRSLEQKLAAVRVQGATAGELAAVAAAHADVSALARMETQAVDLAQAGDFAGARAALFGPDHERLGREALGALEQFRALVTVRTQAQVDEAQAGADRAGLVAKATLTLTALLFLSVLYFVLSRRVTRPLTRMTGIVRRLADQDYDVEVPVDRRGDEITDMNEAIEVFRLNGIERDRLEAERDADQRTKDSILQMMQRTQACTGRGELAEVVACFAPQIFPAFAGRLYILDEQRNALASAAAWLAPQHSAEVFPPLACWGLRRGRPHPSHGDAHDIACPHLHEVDALSLCTPLNALGEIVGLLYLEAREPGEDEGQVQPLFLELVSDNVALTLGNLRLRERLADLAERDGLTGLSNRRTLDEALAGLDRTPGAAFACVMTDIDHFKRFNDTFGHDAGDSVMRHVAGVLREAVADLGHAYRFGGEEFTLLLPGIGEDEATRLAETVRDRVARAQLAHHGRLLGAVTLSLGVAASVSGEPAASVLQRADAALLAAKSAGRNQTKAA